MSFRVQVGPPAVPIRARLVRPGLALVAIADATIRETWVSPRLGYKAGYVLGTLALALLLVPDLRERLLVGTLNLPEQGFRLAPHSAEGTLRDLTREDLERLLS